ncbi:MAG: electron transfer flavoprotein subunit alpha/FixB family protein [Alphaproteobacteria bacterium]
MSAPSGILVIAEAEDGVPTALSREMLGLARRLADDLGGGVDALLLGEDLGDSAGELIAFGADRVHIGDGAPHAVYLAEAWMPRLMEVAGRSPPVVILAGHTTMGADLAPRLSFRLGTTVATACIEAEVVEGRLHATRPCYGGAAREVVSFKTEPAVLTIKAKSQAALDRDDGRRGHVLELSTDIGQTRVRVVERRIEATAGVRLETAKVIVAGGRGINGHEGFKKAQELADVLGGAVGASRVACDLEWCPPSYQIGLSGRTVAPELYIALGISGAGQHMAGCGNAKTIVAVNIDPDAQIFQSSRFGIVGDCHEILPPLIDELRKLKSGRGA